jgi:hypothetical protein
VFRQSGKASNGGGGPGNVVLPSTPNSGNLLVCLAAANGAGISSIMQTNVTWTQRRHDNVAAVGALDLWTGAVGASASATATWQAAVDCRCGIRRLDGGGGWLELPGLTATGR